jgi:uncharacterized DUF497 family protein
MSSTFDPDKDGANIAKHGLSLVEGEGVLNDRWALRSKMSPRKASLAGSRLARTPAVSSWLWCGRNAMTASG